jgi:hypothetical protein
MHHANYNESECHVCGNVNPEQIFNIVESRVLDEYGQATNTRKLSPKEWSEYYKNFLQGKEDPLEMGKGIPEINFKTPNKFKQFIVFMKRDILSKISDIQYIVITLIEAPILAFFLSFLIRYFDKGVTNAQYSFADNENLPVYIFMSVIVGIFMGLTVSAEELIKDRKILKREAFLNLSWNSYLMSKVFVQFMISAIQALTFVIIGNSITGVRGLWFQYWLVLFSCWTSANMLGLLISDSFKAVVTIYIVIPILVIPQIVLSGVIVKFDKLNPDISSPVSIPFYGEIITSRWGYEALAVEQFMKNKYERQFYDYDKIKSQSQFIKTYWISEIIPYLDAIANDLDKSEKDPDYIDRVTLVRNEIEKQTRLLPAVKFQYKDLITPDKITREVIDAARKYTDQLKTFYIQAYNRANSKKENLIAQLESSQEEAVSTLKRKYYNDKLDEFVMNRNDSKKIISINNRLVQAVDPIYLDPDNKFIKAHFYAPRKQVFGYFVPTFVVNVIVIWTMTFLLYLALYFRLLKKVLESGAAIIGRSMRSSD